MLKPGDETVIESQHKSPKYLNNYIVGVSNHNHFEFGTSRISIEEFGFDVFHSVC